MKKTVKDIIQKKAAKIPIVCLTAYTYNIARIIDEYVDIVLVGDSVASVLYGKSTTIDLSLSQIIEHAKAVVSACTNALVVVDMPFNTYRSSKEKAYENAATILQQTNADAVKLEGGEEIADIVLFLTKNHIPVMGHIGLMPQSEKFFGGFKVQGKIASEKNKIVADAIAVQNSGAFAIVIECVKEDVTRAVSKKLKVPLIGIGAGKKCDGQILVTDDMLGLTPKAPKFVKKYTNLEKIIKEAVQTYKKEVEQKKFPDEQHKY
jgi:3-methyl-2-oxobutanoate hydroxymethyltransferase